eukprot:6421037-Lingulodinium_polyedra.AAC.1
MERGDLGQEVSELRLCPFNQRPPQGPPFARGGSLPCRVGRRAPLNEVFRASLPRPTQRARSVLARPPVANGAPGA